MKVDKHNYPPPKRKKKAHHAHHGGSWKIAYADFVTAMMAFFMMMWLINVTSDEQRRGIADYFSATIVDMKGRSGGSGMMGGINVTGPNNSNTETKDSLSLEEQEFSSDEEVLDPENTPEGKKQEAPKLEEAGAGKERGKGTQSLGEEDSGKERDNEKIKGEILEERNKEKENGKDKDKKADKGDKELDEKMLEQKRFKELAQDIKTMIQKNPDLKDLLSQVIIEIRPEGIRIQLVDEDKKPMFPSGNSDLLPRARSLMKIVTDAVKKLPNKISIAGHTDAIPYSNTRDYGNWELSSDRANSSRRFLEQNGIASDRFETIVGKEATEPLIKEDPNSSRNRRISILLIREHPLASAGKTKGQ